MPLGPAALSKIYTDDESGPLLPAESEFLSERI